MDDYEIAYNRAKINLKLNDLKKLYNTGKIELMEFNDRLYKLKKEIKRITDAKYS